MSHPANRPVWTEEVEGVETRFWEVLSPDGRPAYCARPVRSFRWFKRARTVEELRELVRWELRARG